MTSENYTKKMLDGWYCRSIANLQANEAASRASPSSEQAGSSSARQQREESKEYSSESSSDGEPEPNYRAQYIALKKKLKYLIYENECFQDALRSGQKRLLKVSRDRSFLLDRLLQYEKQDSSTSESEDTASSDDNNYPRTDTQKRKKIEASATQLNLSTPVNKQASAVKRKRAVVPKKALNPSNSVSEVEYSLQKYSVENSSSFDSCEIKSALNYKKPLKKQGLFKSAGSMPLKAIPGLGPSLGSDGHMTPEEVERHLQSRQSFLELLPERAPPTVPTEMFSNDPSLDSESNDVLENSPNVEEWFD